ncbi:phosphotriesterase family protein [Neobacillus terrae]|uniref:phosphotriesterase family protein n=1 Tax=Neobacillus terrae TaxID=3034837 RepID=UPI001407363A|nr:phosphotriesterase-related protein [Neobacillus terrae]NHM31434.1 phosphotriesterase-related protein [Neobacillus terrae]
MKIHSVAGEVAVEQVQKTMIHEHLVFDLSGVRNDTDSILENNDALNLEIEKLKVNGCNTLIEVSNMGMGRDAQSLYDISQAFNLVIVASTGWYKESFYPDYVFTTSKEDLAAKMISDLTVGMDGTSIKAGLISEIGSSLNEITPTEYKVFEAAIQAQKETGAPLSTHTEIGTMGKEQLAIFKNHNVNLKKISFGHQDLNLNFEEQCLILDSGAYMQFDTVGKNRYRKDEDRADNLVALLNKGYEDQLMLSCDITRRSHLLSNNGYGYSHLFTVFVPMLKERGVSDEVIEKMLVLNPRKFLAY